MFDSVEKDKTLPETKHAAPGGPGAEPRWTSSAKTGVGTSVSKQSRVWFTLGNGVLNEIYFPDIDKANTRSVRFLISDGEDFFSDEEVDAEHQVRAVEAGVPAYRGVSTCKQGRYRLTKEITAEAVRDTLLLEVRFEVLDGSRLRLYVLVEPHLGDQGAGNTAWVGTYKGLPMLFGGRANRALALYASVPFGEASCGFVGVNDGPTQLRKQGRLKDEYNIAKDGNVALCAELAGPGDGTPMLLALAFGGEPAEAGQQARAGVLTGFAPTQREFVREWTEVQAGLRPMRGPEGTEVDLYRVSTAVLRTHESKRFAGGFVASLSLPWGFDRGDKDVAAYHVLWPRDLCETAMGLLACGDDAAARRALFYLACTQEKDGSWAQNMWLDGTMHWGAIQMDGIALPILLADQLRREDALDGYDAWPTVRKACTFLLRMGPTSQQDRWEELAGYAIFTMACETAALLGAADFAEAAGEMAEAELLRRTADAWNEAIDHFLYARGTALAKQYGVDGYYLRLATDAVIEDKGLDALWLHLKNHRALGGHHRVVSVVSPDALALVRLGLRAADDPRMVATVTVIDGELEKTMATGRGWIRSTDDGYGEHADGAPYNGHGVGRCWPLLAGERGHYELARGNMAAAEEMLLTIGRQASPCGMIPEQVWDAEDLPKHELFNGHPTGSGMPLAWAHAEYVKLLRSREEGRVWDMPPQPVERYQRAKTAALYAIWTEEAPREWVPAGRDLRMDFADRARLRWVVDGAEAKEVETNQPVLGRHCAVLALPPGWQTVVVTVEQGGKERVQRLVSREVE